MERILAIQIKRIGDLILTAPAIRLLRRHRPDAHITLITADAAGQLASCIPGIDEHLNYRSGKSNPAIWATLLSEHYDVSLDFDGTDRSVAMSLVAGAAKRCAYTKRAVGFPRSIIFTHTNCASLKKLHTIDHMCALLETMDIIPETRPEPLQLEIPVSIQEKSQQILQQHDLSPDTEFALIHPGTARSEKYWSPADWATVIDHLVTERNLPIVITGGSDEEEIAHITSIQSSCSREARNQIVDLSGTISLTQTAYVISQAHIALGVDTAAMHLASAFERPQIVLYGPTNPYHWRPLNQQAQVILAGHDQPLGEDDFQIKTPETSMDLITRQLVIQTINQQLNRS